MATIFDVVGVYDNSFTPLFTGAITIKAHIKETAKEMEHPVEDGGTITDFRIINPIEIDLSLLLPQSFLDDIYAQIKTVYLGSNLLVVQTKTGTYRNMMIKGMPHIESPDFYNQIPLEMNLKEVIIVQAQFGKLPPSAVKTAKNSSTVDRGEQQPADAAPASVLDKLAFGGK